MAKKTETLLSAALLYLLAHGSHAMEASQGQSSHGCAGEEIAQENINENEVTSKKKQEAYRALKELCPNFSIPEEEISSDECLFILNGLQKHKAILQHIHTALKYFVGPLNAFSEFGISHLLYPALKFYSADLDLSSAINISLKKSCEYFAQLPSVPLTLTKIFFDNNTLYSSFIDQLSLAKSFKEIVEFKFDQKVFDLQFINKEFINKENPSELNLECILDKITRDNFFIEERFSDTMPEHILKMLTTEHQFIYLFSDFIKKMSETREMRTFYLTHEENLEKFKAIVGNKNKALIEYLTNMRILSFAKKVSWIIENAPLMPSSNKEALKAEIKKHIDEKEQKCKGLKESYSTLSQEFSTILTALKQNRED